MSIFQKNLELNKAHRKFLRICFRMVIVLILRENQAFLLSLTISLYK